MFHSLLAAVRAETSGLRALESVRTLARFHRVQASPGYDAAAAWVADRLAAEGLDVEIENVPADGRTRYRGHVMPEGWACDRAVATLVDESSGTRETLCDVEAEALSLVLRSDPVRGRFPLVAVPGGAAPADYEGVEVRGAVVLTTAPVHRALELAVHGRGAAGLLTDTRRLVAPVRDAFTDMDALAYTSFWWAGDAPRGWGFVVTPRVAARLRARLGEGARLALDVTIESRRFPTTIPLVTASVPGTGAGEVLVLSHLCHPRPSANDNASGAAALLETARVVARLRERGTLPGHARTIRFLWMPEFHGTFAWLARDPARAGRLVAALNLDMVGQNQDVCGSTLMLERAPCFAGSFAEPLLAAIRRAALDWIGGYEGVASLTRIAEVPYAGGSDHAVLVDPAVGVPCPMLLQWPDRFYHSSLDTPEKTDPDSLALAVRCAATYAAFVAGADAKAAAWLEDLVALDARARLLDQAAAGVSPDLAAERWTVWLRSALESLARLGARGDAATRIGAFVAFAGAHAGASRGAGGAAARSSAGGDARVPRRGQLSMVGHLRHLIDGYDALPPDTRESFAAFDVASAAHASLLEVAWYAADGRRDLAAIRRLLRLETAGRPLGVPDVGAWFDWTARLGLSDWA